MRRDQDTKGRLSPCNSAEQVLGQDRHCRLQKWSGPRQRGSRELGFQQGSLRIGCSPHRSASCPTGATSSPHDAQCNGLSSAPLSFPTTWLRPSVCSLHSPSGPARLCSLSSTSTHLQDIHTLAAARPALPPLPVPPWATSRLCGFKTVSTRMTPLSFPWTPDSAGNNPTQHVRPWSPGHLELTIHPNS